MLPIRFGNFKLPFFSREELLEADAGDVMPHQESELQRLA
jgi:hypothetical protein